MKAVLVSIFLLLPGCWDAGDLIPPEVDRSTLLAAPDTIQVDARQVILSTEMWRDFQPISPPGGKPLIVIAYVTPLDKAGLPPQVEADAIWIIRGNEIWKSWLQNEHTPPKISNQLVRVARNGPLWGPGEYVTVVVRLIGAKGTTWFLRADHQLIFRTD